MLILPYQTRVSLRSAPLVTLALILASVAVFFYAQIEDERSTEEALAYYEQSALPELELQGYQAWLEAKGQVARKQLEDLQAAERDGDLDGALDEMQANDDFMRDLHDFRVVTPDQPEFLQWRDQRNKFDALQSVQTADDFLLKRGASTVWRFFSYQFLHGDLGHLTGNMILLLLAGSFAEPALGRVRFALGYLLSGAAAGALHIAVTDAPVIGASGAIAGTMAMLGVLYGLRRVPVFLWVLFYFGTVRIPAVWLLPIWVANEAWQWSTSSDSTVAYAAHLGGFVFGGIYALLVKPRGLSEELRDDPDPDSAETHRADLQLLMRAEQAAAQFETERAAKLFGEMANRHPTRADYALAQYNLARLGDEPALLAAATRRMLDIRPDFISTPLARAYLNIARSPQRADLPLDAQLRLVRRLVRVREDDAALKLLDALLTDDDKRVHHGPALAECMDKLISTYVRMGMTQLAEQLRGRRATLPPGPAAPPSNLTATPSTLDQRVL